MKKPNAIRPVGSGWFRQVLIKLASWLLAEELILADPRFFVGRVKRRSLEQGSGLNSHDVIIDSLLQNSIRREMRRVPIISPILIRWHARNLPLFNNF